MTINHMIVNNPISSPLVQSGFNNQCLATVFFKKLYDSLQDMGGQSEMLPEYIVRLPLLLLLPNAADLVLRMLRLFWKAT